MIQRIARFASWSLKEAKQSHTCLANLIESPAQQEMSSLTNIKVAVHETTVISYAHKASKPTTV